MRFSKHTIISSLLGVAFSANSFAFYTQNGSIYDPNNHVVNIDGIAWNGFQDTQLVQGLTANPFYSLGQYQGSYARTYGMLDIVVRPWDFADSGVTRDNGVSLKTMRVPIQPGVLYDTNEIGIKKSLANKADPTKGNGVFCKSWQTSGSSCATAVSAKDAFWIFLQELKRQKIYALIDFHHRYGYGDIYRDCTVYPLTQYEIDLKLILDEIKARSLTNVIGIDVFNEPCKLRWFQDYNDQPAWIKVIASAAKLIQANNPDLLVFVEGAGPGSNDPDQPPTCVKTEDLVPDAEGYTITNDATNCAAGTQRVSFKGTWGEDFKPLLSKSSAKNGLPVFDRPAFEQRLKTAGLNDTVITWLLGDATGKNSHLVLSPHVYSRETTNWETAPGKPSELRFDWNWNFMNKAGYPVVIGEIGWHTAEGMRFVTDTLTPYLRAHGEQHNVIYWAIGYLGGLVSLISPSSDGTVRLEVEKTLHDLFLQAAINTGHLNLSFTDPGFPIAGKAIITLAETQQTYDCSYTGCSIILDAGAYHVNVASTYQIDNTSHQVYRVDSINNPASVQVTAGNSVDLNLPLQGEQTTLQPSTTVNYTINLLDATGNAESNTLVAANLSFTDKANSQNKQICSVQQGKCTAVIFNQNMNMQTGNFNAGSYLIELPSQLVVNNQTYVLVADKSDQKVDIATSPTISSLRAFYQKPVTPPVDNGSCSVKLVMQNRWTAGATVQGSITNTSEKAIREFNFQIKFNSTEITNPSIVSAWIGQNGSVSKNGDIFTLTAKTYDQSSGLLPKAQQNIGFNVRGTVLKDINVNVLSCNAK